MSWWGKILGGTFGFMLGGPLGALLGAVLGRRQGQEQDTHHIGARLVLVDGPDLILQLVEPVHQVLAEAALVGEVFGLQRQGNLQTGGERRGDDVDLLLPATAHTPVRDSRPLPSALGRTASLFNSGA